ncbi:MAG: class I SAM-dependent methyltransferase [Flavobacteriales bacterium]|nr:class I SAM-dependent methyltransferase [Flavobacteriales bacterium]
MSTEKYIRKHLRPEFRETLVPVILQLREDLLRLDIEKLDLAPYQKSYFLKHHIKRVDFSLVYSARLLCEVADQLKKPFAEINLVDLGAGMGTSYLLAARLGFRSVVYNDIVDDSCRDAAKLCGILGVELTQFVTGDLEAVKSKMKESHTELNALISRNVIEHLPDLNSFYFSLSSEEMVVVQGTSANPYNPLMALWHARLHLKYEPIFRKRRLQMIVKHDPNLETLMARKIAAATREYYGRKLLAVVDEYRRTKKIVAPKLYVLNTVEPETGSWNERILTKGNYDEFAIPNGFDTKVIAGFWDESYSSVFRRLIGKCLNMVISLSDQLGLFLSPFMIVVNRKKK